MSHIPRALQMNQFLRTLATFCSLTLIILVSQNALSDSSFPGPGNTLKIHSSFQTANPKATLAAKKILKYLASLRGRSVNKVLSGQFPGHKNSVDTYFENFIGKLHDQTGKWVAILAADYGGGSTNFTPRGSTANARLIDYWNKGGLITIGWHALNPWTGEDSWSKNGVTSLTTLTIPGTDAHKTWISDLDRIADGLAELQDAGVIVLWRPFHEVNGGWFWWGVGTPQEYSELWRHMFNYFTIDRGLNNLLWVYSPSGQTPDDKKKPAVYFYPGGDVVDIVGLDRYGPNLKQSGILHHYHDMIALGKPFGLCEYGPGKNVEEGQFDYSSLIHQIRDEFPAISFWVSWGGRNAMATNLNAKELLNDPLVVTREKLDW